MQHRPDSGGLQAPLAEFAPAALQNGPIWVSRSRVRNIP
jgi:hypothetical protein